MVKVKQLKPFEVAKFGGFISLYAGFVMGLIYSVGGTIYELYHGIPLNRGTVLAYSAIPIMPVYFAVAGFLVGLVGAYLFNKTSKWVGGVKVDFKRS